MATSDRKGRDGVNPWAGASPAPTSHLRVVHGKMCRRGACPLATLAVAASHIYPRAVKLMRMGQEGGKPLPYGPCPL